MELSSPRQIGGGTAVLASRISGERCDGWGVTAARPLSLPNSKPHVSLPAPQMAGSLPPRGPDSLRGFKVLEQED